MGDMNKGRDGGAAFFEGLEENFYKTEHVKYNVLYRKELILWLFQFD
jgi:hypothetical protein